MEGKTSPVVISVVCLTLGILIGAGVGYAVFSSSNSNSETTYWFYIDYGWHQNTTGTATNKWIFAKSDTVIDGLNKALNNSNIKNNDVRSDGKIYSINGVEPTWTANNQEGWGCYLWTANNGDTELNGWQPTVGLDITKGNIFYLAVSLWDTSPINGKLTQRYDPNMASDWKNGGPFVAS